MQKAGMHVTAVVLPVTNKNSSKEVIKFVGYTREDGLYEKLLQQHRELTARTFDEWPEEEL